MLRMNNTNRDASQKIKTRLFISGVIVVISQLLSTVTFYYFYLKAPLIPLLIALIGAIPMGFIVAELRQLTRVKKTQ